MQMDNQLFNVSGIVFQNLCNNTEHLPHYVGSVGIATGYGLDGPGIKSRWRRDFSHTSRLSDDGLQRFCCTYAMIT
jgi:hypothetical protein